jgi:DNA-binding NtrC family response regulator
MARPVASEGKSIHVLVASSDAFYAQHLCVRLQKKAMIVSSCQTQQIDAYERLDLSETDVIVVETHGLRDNAWSFLEQAREQTPLIEIVAICSDLEIEGTVSALRNGVFAILTYPVSDDELAEAIVQASQRKAKSEQRLKALNCASKPFD